MAVVAESATIMNALRSGLVPKDGLEHFATGLDTLIEAVNQELDFVSSGKGLAKWIRGEYGTGKTFAARHLCAMARQRKFATSEVQISVNDTPLHRLETVYRRLIERLETAADGPNAFQAIVEGWLSAEKGDGREFWYSFVQLVGADVSLAGLALDVNPDPTFSKATGVCLNFVGGVIYLVGQVGEFVTRPEVPEKALRNQGVRG